MYRKIIKKQKGHVEEGISEVSLHRSAEGMSSCDSKTPQANINLKYTKGFPNIQNLSKNMERLISVTISVQIEVGRSQEIIDDI